MDFMSVCRTCFDDEGLMKGFEKEAPVSGGLRIIGGRGACIADGRLFRSLLPRQTMQLRYLLRYWAKT
jgi:hypothetical protein